MQSVPLQRRAPTVSVVIPAYNAAAFIGEALDSVFAQTYDDYEIVVVNDGSSDAVHLQKTLQGFRDRIRYFSQRNQGPSAARNLGVQHAAGRFVAFLDSDDQWLPGFLEAQIKCFDGRPENDLLYTDADFFRLGERNKFRFMQLNPSERPVTFARLARRQAVVLTSSVVARRKALVETGLFNPEYRHSEDFDLWLRMLHCGYKLDFQEKVLVRKRWHAESLGADGMTLLRGQTRVCRVLLESLQLNADEVGALEERIDFATGRLALEEGKQRLQIKEYGGAMLCFRQAYRTLGGVKLLFVCCVVWASPALMRWMMLSGHRLRLLVSGFSERTVGLLRTVHNRLAPSVGRRIAR